MTLTIETLRELAADLRRKQKECGKMGAERSAAQNREEAVRLWGKADGFGIAADDVLNLIHLVSE
jgi:hypothetical protein